MANRSSFGPFVLVIAALSCSFYVACGDDDVIIDPIGNGGTAAGSAGRAGSAGKGGKAGSAGRAGSAVAGTGPNAGTGAGGTGAGGTGELPPDAGDGNLPDSGADTGPTSNN
jgi:hypothetical protein